jgi:hypothetical protein
MKLEMTQELAQETVAIPDANDGSVTRHVKAGSLRVLMWDTYTTGRNHHTMMGYAVWWDNEVENGDEEPLFVGDDFGCPYNQAVDSDKCVLSLLAFLTQRKGDTDADYFDNYTERQLAWSESDDCESLACDVIMYEDGGDFTLRDIEV